MKTNRELTEKFFITDQKFHNLLQCVGGLSVYSKGILELIYVTGIDFIPALHSNQNLLDNVFSKMRQLGKDITDLHDGGVLQQNVMNDMHGSQKVRK